MRRALAALIVGAALYALLMFLTGSVNAISVVLAPGDNVASCPDGYRIGPRALRDQNLDGYHETVFVNCVALVTPTGTATTAQSPVPTASPTRTPLPPSPTSVPTTSPPSSHPSCQNRPPLGAIPPAVSIWCHVPLAPEITTHQSGANSWVDDWQHGQSNARLDGTGYRVGVLGDRCFALHFRHANHWMSDTMSEAAQYPTLCSTWLRPDRSFLANGRLVIETEVAVPIAGTRNAPNLSDSWPEVVISNASQPTRMRNNGTYVYETFPGSWTFGCRLQQNRQPLCALYNTGQSYAGSSDRVWEINQDFGQVRYQSGGLPTSSAQHNAAWKQCTSTDDPDTVCRNVFRLEFWHDGSGYVFDLYVNGFLYYRAGLNPGMESLFASPLYVYFGSFAYRIGGDFSVPIIRFHWDHILIAAE